MLLKVTFPALEVKFTRVEIVYILTLSFLNISSQHLTKICIMWQNLVNFHWNSLLLFTLFRIPFLEINTIKGLLLRKMVLRYNIKGSFQGNFTWDNPWYSLHQTVCHKRKRLQFGRWEVKKTFKINILFLSSFIFIFKG